MDSSGFGTHPPLNLAFETAARGLETEIERQHRREHRLLEENKELRDAGRKLAAEVTVARIAAAEKELEHEKVRAKLNEISAAFTAYRADATTELARLRRENARLNRALASAESGQGDLHMGLIANAEAARKETAAAKAELSEYGIAHRKVQLEIGELRTRLDRERTIAQTATAELALLRDENEARLRELRTAGERESVQSRIELEARLKQAEFEIQNGIELAHREHRDRIAELERSLQTLSEALEAERKLKHEADGRRREAEEARDDDARAAAARVRRLESECAELSEELRRKFLPLT